VRKRHVTILASLLLLIGVALYLFSLSTPEPVYGGRKLSDWLHDYNFATTSERHIRAEDAVRHIGTNALPFLLNWIDYKGMGVMTQPRTVYNEVQNKTGRGPFWEDTRKERAYRAAKAIASLGPEAKAAVPLLSTMLNADGERSFLAANTLAHLGTNGLPPLLAEIANTNAVASRFHALGAARFLGSNALPALPLLIQCLSENDPFGVNVAQAAAYSLGELRLDPNSVVPALATCVNGTNAALQLEAITALGKFGPSARPAASVLRTALTNFSLKVRKAATNALTRIDTEAATNTPPR